MLYIFSGYGTTLCCSRIEVILNGDIQGTQGSRSGVYQKGRGLFTNRSHWNQIGGGNSLWYEILINAWFIGSSSNIGDASNTDGGINSVQDTACPTSDNRFQFFDGTGFILLPINSVSIQCV